MYYDKKREWSSAVSGNNIATVVIIPSITGDVFHSFRIADGGCAFFIESLFELMELLVFLLVVMLLSSLLLLL